MVKSDNRKRIIINFKNNELETKIYDHVRSLELEGYSSYIKKLIYEDMKKQGLIK